MELRFRKAEGPVAIKRGHVGAFEFGPMPPQVSAEILSALVKAEVATIGHWRLWGFCDHRITRVKPGEAVVGTAITVACAGSDNAALHYAIGLVRPGDVLVVEQQSDRNVACAGAVLTRAALQAGARALIIDGPCTDVQDIRAGRLPVWSRGVSARTSKVGDRGGRINRPVSVGGVAIMPGDAILCDDNGVLALNPAEAEAEAFRAIESQARSHSILQQIEEGTPLSEISGAKAIVERLLASA